MDREFKREYLTEIVQKVLDKQDITQVEEIQSFAFWLDLMDYLKE